jgi:hypothetical protein
MITALSQQLQLEMADVDDTSVLKKQPTQSPSTIFTPGLPAQRAIAKRFCALALSDRSLRCIISVAIGPKRTSPMMTASRNLHD